MQLVAYGAQDVYLTGNPQITFWKVTYRRYTNFAIESIEQGWSVKKNNNSYVFSKKHENKKEVLEESYLLKFMKTNLDLNKMIN